MSALLRLRCVFNGHSSSFRNTSAVAAIRGPKKKAKKDVVELPDNPDIVNIFKGSTDAPVYPTDMYPPFVLQLIDKNYTPDEIMLQMYRGERIPSAKEQWSLSNSMFRMMIKDRNSLFKNNYEYESEDDIGEDLGGNPDEADLEAEAATTATGGEAAATAAKTEKTEKAD